MKSQFLFLVVAFAVILSANGFRIKREIDACESLVCPEGSVKCNMYEDNKDNIDIIKTVLRCINENDFVLREEIKTRPNLIKGMKISRQKSSINISKVVNSQDATNQLWDMKKVQADKKLYGYPEQTQWPTYEIEHPLDDGIQIPPHINWPEWLKKMDLQGVIARIGATKELGANSPKL